MAELVCAGVACSYGDATVLSDLDLVVPEGGLTAILGASGSGKSTLLRLVMGLMPLGSGTISVGGTVVSDAAGGHLAPHKRGVGYVSQEGSLYPHLRVGENVGFGLPRTERKSSPRIEEVLELVGLSAAYAARRVQELSGGEQRRVALARALAPRPKLVLLDEPFSALDAGLRVETRQAVMRALAEEGSTAVMVTHDQAEALSMGKEVAVLRDGRIVQQATPVALYQTPVDVQVACFVGDAVIVPGVATGDRVRCVFGELSLHNDGGHGPVQVALRPEQIELRRWNGPRDLSPRVAPVVATVVGLDYLGSETVVQLQLAESGVTVSAKVFSHSAPRAGETVELAVCGPVMVYPAGVQPGNGDSEPRTQTSRPVEPWQSAG